MKDYNLKYSHNTSLWESAENPEEMLGYIKYKKEELETILEPHERVEILGEIGNYSRILKNLDEAEAFLNEAIALIDDNDIGVVLWIQNGIRLAHLYQWQDRYEIAEHMLYDLEEMCNKKEIADYEHVVLQHLGYFYFQIGAFDEALESFDETQKLREKLGDQTLIDSTKYAIAMTKIALEEKEEKEDNVIDFPTKSDYEGGKLKSTSDFVGMVKDHFEGGEFNSIEEMNEELQQISSNQNSMSAYSNINFLSK